MTGRRPQPAPASVQTMKKEWSMETQHTPGERLTGTEWQDVILELAALIEKMEAQDDAEDARAAVAETVTVHVNGAAVEMPKYLDVKGEGVEWTDWARQPADQRDPEGLAAFLPRPRPCLVGP